MGWPLVMDDELMADAAAELVAAFTVTFFAAGSLLVQSLQTGSTQSPSLLTIAATTGAGYALAIALAGPRSGGHANPVVSLAAWLSARLEAKRAGAYILAQLVGGIGAALVLGALVPDTALDQARYGATVGGNHTGALSAVTWELAATFFYTLAVLAAVFGDRSRATGIATAGLGAFLAVLVAFPFTGASFNPARSLGPALLSGTWTMQWVYVAGPVLGAALAAGVHDGILQPSQAQTGADR